MKIRCWVSIGGCKREDVIEIPDVELEGLSPSARQDAIEEYAREFRDETVEWGWSEVAA